MQRKWTKWEWAEMLLFAGPVTLICGGTAIMMLLSLIVTLLGFHGHSHTRENARRASCQSNLKQIALALNQYSQDYNKFPPAINSASGTGNSDNWISRIIPYVKAPEVFQCYSDNNATDAQKSSYGYNARLAMAAPPVKNAASVILNFEVQADSSNRTQTGNNPTNVSANKRHLDGANYSFADGHVKWMKLERVANKKPDGKNYTFLVN